MSKEKNMSIQTNVKNSMIFFGVVSIVMFLFMFLEEALIDDGAFHIGRLWALSEDITWNNLKPWIYSRTNFGTGYPLGIFYPDLFIYPFALLAKTPVGLYASYVIMMMSINFASVASFYFCVRKILQYRGKENYEKLAFVMAVMYLAYPYRLWCLYARMAIGECMFFVFFPIVMLGVYELFYNRKFSLMLFVGMTGMVYSHILSTAMCIAILIVFYLINIKNLLKYPKIILYTLINAVLTLLCGSSVVLPILEMQSFTEMYYMTGVKTFGTVVSNSVRIINNDNLAIVCTIVAIILCAIMAYKGNSKMKLASASIFVIFMWTDMFCWGVLEDAFPFINTIQFTFRILGIAGFTLSILMGLALHKHKPLYISYPIIVIVSFFVLIMGKYHPINTIEINGDYSVGKGEYVTVELHDYLLKNGKIPNVKDEYNIKKIDDTYIFEAKDGAVVLPLGYYKGYKISGANKVYEYSKEQGLIKVEGLEDTELKVEYVGTSIQKVSLAVSVITFIGVVIGYIYWIRRKKQNEGKNQ